MDRPTAIQVLCDAPPLDYMCEYPNQDDICEALATLNIPSTINKAGNTLMLGLISLADLAAATGNVKLMRTLFHSAPVVKMIKTKPGAVLPQKARGSDVGFDLTIIEKIKDMRPSGCTVLYDTGIQARVPFGHYLEIVPRSSLSKTGWMLANSTGIIDPSYTGNMLVAVARVDPDADTLPLPFCGFQLIVRRQEHMEIQEIQPADDDTKTGRGDGGFGSTGPGPSHKPQNS